MEFARFLDLVRDCEVPGDLLVACYRFAMRNIHLFYGAGVLPGRLYLAESQKSVHDDVEKFLDILSNDRKPAVRIDEQTRDELVEELNSTDEQQRCVTVLALIKATEALIPEYPALAESLWKTGKPLNRKFRDLFEIHPKPFAPKLSPLQEYLEYHPHRAVTRRAQRGVYADELFERHVIVDVSSTRYALNISPEHLDNPHLSLTRVGSIDQVIIGSSCVAGGDASPVVMGEIVEDSETAEDNTLVHRFYCNEPPTMGGPDYRAIVSRLCDQEGMIVVLPELSMSSAGEAEIVNLLRNGSDKELPIRPLLLVAGSRHVITDGVRVGQANIYDGHGKFLWSFEKLHPAFIRDGRDSPKPGNEHIAARQTVIIRDTPLGRISVVICSDLDQTEVCEFLASAGVDMVLAPTLNPGRQRTSLYASTTTNLAKRSRSLIVSANSCFAHRAVYRRPAKAPRELSFVYLPVASREGSVAWQCCQNLPGGCEFRVRIGEFPIRAKSSV